MISLRIAAVAVLAAACSAPAVAQSDAELRERFIAASEQMGENMLDVIRDCAPDIDMSGIEVEYTPAMTEAAHCVVETHIERYGKDETEVLVEQAEAMAERSFSSLQEMANMQQDYPELSSEALIELNQECGTLEASRELPMNQLMRDNMSRLAACYSAGE
jgi:hypothetical protein